MMISRLGLAVIATAAATHCLAGEASAQQVVAARTLRAGTIIAKDDLASPPGVDAMAAAHGERFIGLETRRVIYAGRPLDERDIGAPILVRRNSLVAMVYRHGGLGIRAEGRALDSGGAGEVVRVMNLGSRQTVAALVTAANMVEIRR